MKLKKLFAVGLIATFLIVMVVKIYGVQGGLTPELLKDTNSPENREKIAEIVLTDMGKTDSFKPAEVINIRAFYGNVNGDDKEDLVIIVELGPTYTLTAVYAGTDNGFEYLGELPPLFTVENMQLVNAPRLGKDLIVIRESVNQRVGAFENSVLIKLYLWDSTGLKQVGIFPEKIKTDWNSAFDQKEANPPSDWRRIVMDTKITLKNATDPEIGLDLYQQYLNSSDTVTRNIPPDATYSTVADRDVPVTFFWSDKWLYFILYEKIETATGEKVAVIDDLANSPYALIPEYKADTANKYQIIRSDGSKAIVDKSTLSDLPKE